MTNYQTLDLFAATDGTVHINARMDVGDVFVKFLPETTLSDLLEWLSDPSTRKDTILTDSRVPWHARDVSYQHETGKLVLHHPARNEEFDTADGEAVVRFIRKLMRIAPMPHSPCQPNLPIALPEVTAEDLATKRTIYHNAMAAEGARKPRTRKAEYGPDPQIRAKLDNILDDILAGR